MALPNIISQINSKLSLSGGTMIGVLSVPTPLIINPQNSTSEGGEIVIKSPSSTYPIESRIDNYSNETRIIGVDTSQDKVVDVVSFNHNNHNLSLNGNNVLTSAGGNMSGSIIHQATTVIQRKDDTGALWIHGGVAWGDGASLELCGKSRTTNTGGFMIQTNDGTTRKNLTGGPNTDLNWDGKLVVCVTKWKSGTQWYRKYSDGWIEQGGQTPRTSDAYISISFPIAFTQDNPNVQLTRRFYYDNDTSSSQNRTTGVSSVTKTGFKCYDNGWSANGYGTAGVWYACGF